MQKIGIVGSGVMGRGIAQVCVSNSKKVMIYDISEEAIKKGIEEIRNRLSLEVQKGRMDQERAEEALANIQTTESLGELAIFSEFVVEAAPEDLTLKKKIFKQLDEKNPSNILASNTSSISIDLLAEGLSNPSRVVGMHWFNPAPVMSLIEIVVGSSTSAQTVKHTEQLALELGKEPILVKNFPGFASSRLGVALGLEAIRMVEQGVASPEDIDKAMELGYRHPMGPLKLTDYIGLDTRLKIAEYIETEGVSPAFKVPNLLRQMVAEGRLGKKSGEGFYKWE